MKLIFWNFKREKILPVVQLSIDCPFYCLFKFLKNTNYLKNEYSNIKRSRFHWRRV